MINIAFFDVGETLIQNGQPFPGVTALASIAAFETADGRPLVLGIISDYFMPDPAAADRGGNRRPGEAVPEPGARAERASRVLPAVRGPGDDLVTGWGRQARPEDL